MEEKSLWRLWWRLWWLQRMCKGYEATWIGTFLPTPFIAPICKIWFICLRLGPFMFKIIKCNNYCLLEKVWLHNFLFTGETIGHMKSIHKHPIKKRGYNWPLPKSMLIRSFLGRKIQQPSCSSYTLKLERIMFQATQNINLLTILLFYMWSNITTCLRNKREEDKIPQFSIMTYGNSLVINAVKDTFLDSWCQSLSWLRVTPQCWVKIKP